MPHKQLSDLQYGESSSRSLKYNHGVVKQKKLSTIFFLHVPTQGLHGLYQQLFYPYPSDSIIVNMAKCFYSTWIEELEHREKTFYWPWIIWKLWKSRNELIFSNNNIDPRKLVTSAMEEASDWKDNQPLNNALRSNRWKPPPMDILKCNVDATRNKLDNSCGVGWILRNEAGEVKWIGAKNYPKLSSPLEAEATAVTSTCICNLGYNNIQIESDCQTLINAIANPLDWPALSAFVA